MRSMPSQRVHSSDGARTDKGLIACIGCGAFVPDMDGPTHPYIGASPGCWDTFGQVLAKEYGEYRYPDVHRLTVNAYAAQHPGTPSRKAIQSVTGHLISLCCVLELGFLAEEANRVLRATAKYPERSDGMRRVVRLQGQFVWLTPPASLGAITVLDVARAENLAEHERWVRLWAECVWQAWSPHHVTVRALAQQCLR